MGRHKQWTSFVWALFQHYGEECRKTWGWGVGVTLAAGVANAVSLYIRSKGGASFGDALYDAGVSAAVFFILYAVLNFVRTPWLEHNNEHASPRRSDGVLGVGILIVLVFTIAIGTMLISGDLRSEITIHAPADVGGVRAKQMIDYETCRSQLAALTRSEPYDSLRRRTMTVANELYDYLQSRQAGSPPMATPDSRDPNPSDEQKKRIQTWQQYQQETFNYYRAHFMHKIISIIQEYKSKGVNTGFLENDASQNMPFYSAPEGSPAEAMCVDALCKFRELAYHVDAWNNRIDIP